MTTDDQADLSPPMREALAWVIRLTSGAATHADARAFEAWRDQHSDHAAAFQEAVAFRKTLRAMPLPASARPADSVIAFPLHKRNAAISRRTMLVGGGAMAASAAMLTVSPPFGLWLSLAELNAGQRTAVGERRTLRPLDGVTVELNARTAMNLSDNGRTATLVNGEAFISVRPDAPRMLVRVNDALWSVRGADINIRASDRESCVTCLTGRVAREDGSLALASGQQYAVGADSAGRITPSDANRQGGWRQGALLFRNTPLAEAVEDINRYRSGKIILANSAIGQRPVSGMFHTDKIDNASSQIQQLLDLTMVELPGGVVLFS